MLTIFGRKTKFCDGVSRRDFLQIGAFTFGAASLSLADIFRAEARAGARTSQHKAVINIFLGGGPPHQDMWDIKTDAPAEIRGEFKPIGTNVPGIQIGEVFPQDRRADGQVRRHPLRGRCPRRPRCGAVHDRLAGTIDGGDGRPAQPGCRRSPSCRGRSIRRCRRSSAWRRRRSTCPGPIPAGPASWALPYAAFKPDGPGMANMKLDGMTIDSARPTAASCSPASTTCAAKSTLPARSGASTPCRNGPSTC